MGVLDPLHGSFDEWRWWLVGDESGLSRLRALAASRPWIAVDEMEGCRTSRARYHRLCEDENSVYIRLDEATSWLSPTFFQAMSSAAARADVLTAHSNSVTPEIASPAALAAGDWGTGVVPLGHRAVTPLQCFAWSGKTYAKFGALVGSDEATFIFRTAPTKRRGLINVGVRGAACFVGDLAPDPPRAAAAEFRVRPSSRRGSGPRAGWS